MKRVEEGEKRTKYIWLLRKKPATRNDHIIDPDLPE